MLCPRCSAEVLPEQKSCPECKAMLPRQAPTGNPVPTLGIREGVTYLAPTHHYRTENIERLREIVQGLLEGEELFEDLEDQLQLMAESFAEFEDRYAGEMQVLLSQESARFPDDDYNLQLSYLLRRGLQIFEEGCQAFDHFFDTQSEDADELEAAFNKVRDGHDYVCYTLELANGRLQALQQVAADLAELDDDEEYVFVDVPEER
jgi:hypothetical protein